MRLRPSVAVFVPCAVGYVHFTAGDGATVPYTAVIVKLAVDLIAEPGPPARHVALLSAHAPAISRAHTDTPDDLVPGKASTDVLLVGHARSPQARRSIAFGFSVGELSRRLRAVGRAPSRSLPLRSNIFADTPGATGVVASVGPRSVAAAWTAPTKPPHNADFAAFNCAPAEQRLDGLPVAASLELDALVADVPHLSVQLPRITPYAVVATDDGHTTTHELRCDTVLIDSDSSRVTLTFRTILPTAQQPATLIVSAALDGESVDVSEVLSRLPLAAWTTAVEHRLETPEVRPAAARGWAATRVLNPATLQAARDEALPFKPGDSTPPERAAHDLDAAAAKADAAPGVARDTVAFSVREVQAALPFTPARAAQPPAAAPAREVSSAPPAAAAGFAHINVERALAHTDAAPAADTSEPEPNGETIPLSTYVAIAVALHDERASLCAVLDEHGIDELVWRAAERRMRARMAHEAERGERAVLAALGEEQRRCRETTLAATESELTIDEYAIIQTDLEATATPEAVLASLGLNIASWKAIRRDWHRRCLADRQLARRLKQELARARHAMGLV